MNEANELPAPPTETVKLIFDTQPTGNADTSVRRWPWLDWIVACFVSTRKETLRERELRLQIEALAAQVRDLEMNLDFEKKAGQAKDIQIIGMAKVVAFHEAHWKSLAEIQALKIGKPPTHR